MVDKNFLFLSHGLPMGAVQGLLCALGVLACGVDDRLRCRLLRVLLERFAGLHLLLFARSQLVLFLKLSLVQLINHDVKLLE